MVQLETNTMGYKDIPHYKHWALFWPLRKKLSFFFTFPPKMPSKNTNYVHTIRKPALVAKILEKISSIFLLHFYN